MCLAKLGVVGEEDRQALVTRVFVAYLKLMRKLQTSYWYAPEDSSTSSKPTLISVESDCSLPSYGQRALIGHPDFSQITAALLRQIAAVEHSFAAYESCL